VNRDNFRYRTMARAYTEITFTPAVKAAQLRYGSRRLAERMEGAVDRQDTLTRVEQDFIEKRDGFYQATVCQNGWPYVQYRGGPVGFLRVLDPATLAFADFRGNVQYVSVGNISATAELR
jgi:predicted pyridoxine 5'-phosphate oxidase superfamily flavin-nucleotide-binding protein